MVGVNVDDEPAGERLDLLVAEALRPTTYEEGSFRLSEQPCLPSVPAYSTDSSKRHELVEHLRGRGCNVEGPIEVGNKHIWTATLPCREGEEVPRQEQAKGQTSPLALARLVCKVAQIAGGEAQAQTEC